MNVALSLFRYFPHGGMQRDLMATVRELRQRGHRATVFCHTFEGDRPEDVPIETLPVRGTSNHARARSFAEALQQRLAEQRPDVVLGFDKMPGLDLYFAADPCYVARTAGRPWPYRWTPRYRTFHALERSVFGPDGARILLLAEPERAPYQAAYGTPDERFVLLPPGIARDRRRGADAVERRTRCRRTLGFADDTCVLLLIAANFRLKGLELALESLRDLPPTLRGQTHLLAVGEGPGPDWQRRIERLGLTSQCTLLPGRDDIPDLLQAADVLVHPARRDTTGTVLLEAVVAGLPVVCTDTCGYAEHIERSHAGFVASRETFASAVLQARSANLETLSEAALRYADNTDLHGMHARIADEVERF